MHNLADGHWAASVEKPSPRNARCTHVSYSKCSISSPYAVRFSGLCMPLSMGRERVGIGLSIIFTSTIGQCCPLSSITCSSPHSLATQIDVQQPMTYSDTLLLLQMVQQQRQMQPKVERRCGVHHLREACGLPCLIRSAPSRTLQTILWHVRQLES